MHVLFYVYLNESVKGGIERLVSHLANHAREYDWKATILTDCANGVDYPYEIDRKNVNLIALKSELEPEYQEKIRDIILRHEIDVAVVMRTGSWIHQIFAAALANTNTKLVLSEHAAPKIATNEYPNRSRQISLYCADAIHLLLPDYKKSVPSKLHGRVTVIPNFIEIQNIDESHIVDRLEKSRKRLAMVGRLTGKQKRPLLLVQAFATLCNRYPDWDLYFYGSGPEQETMEAYINGRGLQERIFLKGQVGDIISELKNVDVFCLPSAYEGLPISILESFSVGVPAVVFSGAEGNNSIVKHMRNGLHAEGINSHIHLANALEQIISNDQLRHRLSLGALKDVKEFDRNKIIPIWFSFLKNVVNNGKARLNECISEKFIDEFMLSYFLKYELISRNV